MTSETWKLSTLSASGAIDAFVLGTTWWADLRTCLPIGRSTQSPHPPGIEQMPTFSMSPLVVGANSPHRPSPASIATCPFEATHSTARLAPAGTPASTVKIR